ncbi:MAG: RHS repeat-associated core domain-containing protein, partial [Acidimicrobiales bacterium]
MGNLTSITRLSGTAQAVTTSATYDPIYSQLTSLTDPLSHVWTLAHDGNGNLTAVTDPLGHQVTASYNGAGQITSLANAAGTLQFGYAGGDLSSITDPLGKVTTLFTDSAGRLLSTTDPLGHTTSYSYDAMNNLTGISDPLGDTTTLTYDADDNLASVTDALSHVTHYSYDSMDRRASRTDPLGASESYSWDGNGNLIQYTDRRGQVTKYQYDGLNRRTFAGFGWNGSSYASTITYTLDGGNRLTQAVDSITGTIARLYDGLDNLTDEQTPQGEVTYGYDAASRRSSMQVVGQGAVGYGWDNANRLTTLSQGSASVGFGYDNASRRITLALPNGVTVSYAYDNASRITQLSYGTGGAGSTDVGTLTYSGACPECRRRDADGRVISKAGTLAAMTLPANVSGNSFNAANALTGFNGQTLSYDANGNLTNDGTNNYSWDARNHLSGISGGVSASFIYDPFGRRARKTIGGATTQFLYDGLNPVQELDGASPPNVTANLLTGLNIDEYFSHTDSSGPGTFLSDALGSTIGLTNSSGSIATSYTYDPFGNVSASGAANVNPYQFTGRENDATGLYFYRARYYSPTFQRFVSQDPLEFLGGDENLYSYTKNQPTRSADPTGEAPPGSVPPPIEIPINGPGSSPDDPLFPGPPGGAIPPESPAGSCGSSPNQPSSCLFGSEGACVAAGLTTISTSGEDAAIVACAEAPTPAAKGVCVLAIEAAYLPAQIGVLYACHKACS